MIRRNFLVALLSPLMAWLFPKQATESSGPTIAFKRVFRHDGEKWREILWEQIRPGDRVIALSLFDGALERIDVFRMMPGTAHASLESGNSSVEVDEDFTLLPQHWGVGGTHDRVSLFEYDSSNPLARLTRQLNAEAGNDRRETE